MRAGPDFLRMLRVLCANDVEFIVIGGVSAVLQGAPVTTFDLDIIHARSPENLRRLETALRELGAYYREHAERRPVPEARLLAGAGHHLLMTEAGPLDVLGAIGEGRVYDDLQGDAVAMEVAPGISIQVLSLAALIKLKEQLGREKDRAALPVLRRVLREQQTRDGID
jgi:predicted nucleotidyltransferase